MIHLALNEWGPQAEKTLLGSAQKLSGFVGIFKILSLMATEAAGVSLGVVLPEPDFTCWGVI